MAPHDDRNERFLIRHMFTRILQKEKKRKPWNILDFRSCTFRRVCFPPARARAIFFSGEREEDAEKLPVCVYSCFTHTETGRVGYLIPLFKTPENFQTVRTFSLMTSSFGHDFQTRRLQVFIYGKNRGDGSIRLFFVEKHEEISLKTKQATHRKRGGWLGG